MAQSFSNMLIHLVFSTKSRAEFINSELQHELYVYLKAIAKNKHAPVIEIGGISDHIHLLIVLPRTGVVSDLVKNLKKGSTAWVRKKEPKLGHFAWQRGYGAFSVSHSARAKVIEYIKNQEKLHQSKSFQEEYLLLLKMNEIPFDETLIWD